MTQPDAKVTVEALTAATMALAEHGISSDVQELLIGGDGRGTIALGALAKALQAAAPFLLTREERINVATVTALECGRQAGFEEGLREAEKVARQWRAAKRPSSPDWWVGQKQACREIAEAIAALREGI